MSSCGRRGSREVLLLVPNLIGYTRGLVFGVAAWLDGQGHKGGFLLLYHLCWALDGLDGLVARRLSQISRFGAWLDVVTDVVGRGWLWTQVWPRHGYWVACLEWATVVATSEAGATWKQTSSDSALLCPTVVRTLSRNGYKSPWGLWILGSVHGLPVLLYAQHHAILDTALTSYLSEVPSLLTTFLLVLLCAGRLLAGICEVSLIASYVHRLTLAA